MPTYLWITIAVAVAALLALMLIFMLDRKKRAIERAKGGLRFKKLILHEHGCTAEETEYELVKNDNGVRISNYFGNWWDAGEGVYSRKNCLAKRRGGSLELYEELADKFDKLGICEWNGFDETDPNVLDGGGFWLEIELENGEVIYARGMNSYPPNYHEFMNTLLSLFDSQK